MRKAYQHLLIYYFSGTGNARKAALWISNTARNEGIPCELKNIEIYSPGSNPNHGNTLYGIISPTHGFNFPPIVLKFLKKMPNQHSDIFIVNTRGGLKSGKLYLPGLSGVLHYWAWIILKRKGYNIIGLQPLDMPSNWVSLHPGLRTKVVISIQQRCEKIITRFAHNLLKGKRQYKALYSLPFDLAIAPIALLYNLMGRFALAKTFYADYTCNTCGLCIQNCPVNAIQWVNNRPFWRVSCESCMRCLNSCPKNAIQTAHGFVFVLWFWLIPLISHSLFKLFISPNSISSNSWQTQLISWILVLPGSKVFYYAFHFLLRFRFFARIVRFLSFTGYPFWRGYRYNNCN